MQARSVKRYYLFAFLKLRDNADITASVSKIPSNKGLRPLVFEEGATNLSTLLNMNHLTSVELVFSSWSLSECTHTHTHTHKNNK